MARIRRLIACIAFSAVMATTWTGCREQEPLPSHYTDLGDGQRTLVPMRASWHTVPYSRSDTAQWVAFRDPNEDPAPKVEDSVADDTSDEDNHGEVEAEIRELIAEYNEIAREVDPDDPDLEELLEYHVESQQQALAVAFGARAKILARIAAISDALIEKIPDEKERIEASLGFSDHDSSAELAFSAIEVMDAETVKVQLKGGPGQTLMVRLVDDEWFFDVPQLENLTITDAMIDTAITALDGLVNGLKSGAIPAESVLLQFEGPLKAMLGSMLPGQATDEDNGAADENNGADEDDGAGDDAAGNDTDESDDDE